MTDSTLHRFDQRLCRDVLDNILARLDSDAFRAHFRSHMKKPVRQYLQAIDGDDPPPALLLNDQELDDLALAFTGESLEIDRPWVPYTELYRSHIDCVSEILERLAPAYAQEWSEVSERFAAQLSEGRIRLRDGIELVHEWVGEIRRLLRAMGLTALLPYPEGSFPTPTCPQPPQPSRPATTTPPRPDEQVDGSLRTMLAETQALQREMRDLLVSQRTIKDHYSVEEFAQLVGKSAFTCREWCRLGRIRATKKNSGRGKYQSWTVSHEELLRYQKEGLLPLGR